MTHSHSHKPHVGRGSKAGKVNFRYGSPEALVIDGGGTFQVRQARSAYEDLGIAKHEIERGRPWQSYIETHFNIQRRMGD